MKQGYFYFVYKDRFICLEIKMAQQSGYISAIKDVYTIGVYLGYMTNIGLLKETSDIVKDIEYLDESTKDVFKQCKVYYSLDNILINHFNVLLFFIYSITPAQSSIELYNNLAGALLYPHTAFVYSWLFKHRILFEDTNVTNTRINNYKNVDGLPDELYDINMVYVSNYVVIYEEFPKKMFKLYYDSLVYKYIVYQDGYSPSEDKLVFDLLTKDCLDFQIIGNDIQPLTPEIVCQEINSHLLDSLALDFEVCIKNYFWNEHKINFSQDVSYKGIDDNGDNFNVLHIRVNSMKLLNDLLKRKTIFTIGNKLLTEIKKVVAKQVLLKKESELVVFDIDLSTFEIKGIDLGYGQ